MSVKGSMHYRDTGVLDNTELGLRALLGWVNRTSEFRGPGQLGRKAVEVGFYASVVDIGHGLGLALCTDGVGTKVLVAQMLERYDTIGIDCVAMNVNDAICVGAEPMSFLDYIAIESATPAVLEAIGKGLYEGARQAGVNIVGGEISQMARHHQGRAAGAGHRPRRHVRRHRPARPDHRRPRREAGRRHRGLRQQRDPQQWLHAGAQGLVRGGRLEGGRARGGAGDHRGRRAPEAHAHLREAGDGPAARRRPGAGARPHHERRVPEPGAHRRPGRIPPRPAARGPSPSSS